MTNNFEKFKIIGHDIIIPFRYRKAGRVWYGGARESD